MKFYFFLGGFFFFFFSSCAKKIHASPHYYAPKEIIHSQKNDKKSPKKTKKETTLNTQIIEQIISTALAYLGTPYKYAGNTSRGMDCSGLVGLAFLSADIQLNRSSQGISEQGNDISLNEVKIGDLLFFHTLSKKRITHVGLVVEVGESIKFIHSTTSKGVIISDLKEKYWDNTFAKAKRIL